MNGRAALAAGLLAMAAGGAAPGSLSAQTRRDFSASRQLHGETRLTARVEYGAGTLRIAPATGSDLYRMVMSYDAERYTPLSAFDAGSGTARLGLTSAGAGGFHIGSSRQLEQTAFITLSPAVGVDLALELGAVESDIELGGLQLTDLRLSTGASRTTLRFSRPNAGRCARAVLSAGAADMSVLALGNSRCRSVQFDGGVGKVLLDLTGAWPSDARVRVQMAVGALTLRLPRDLGIRLTLDRFLSSFPAAGWTRQGNAYLSPGYAHATRHLDLALSSTLGGIDVEWVN
jgi:hypothetical protein